MQQLPAGAREELVAQMEGLFTQLTERLLPEKSAQLIAEFTEQLPPEASEQLFARLTEQLSSEEQAQLVAQLTTQLPAAERGAMLDALIQNLPAAQRETLLAQLAAQLSPDASEQLFAQLTEQFSSEDQAQLIAQLTTQLPAAERGAMLDALIQNLPAAQRETLLAQLTAQLSPEASEQLLAQLTAQLPAAQREALLTDLSGRLTPEARTAVLSDWTQRLLSPERLQLIREVATLAGPIAAQTRESVLANGAVLAAAQPGAEQAARAALSEPNSMRTRLRVDERLGMASQTSWERASASAEALRAVVEISTTAQAAREPLAPSLRELLGLNLMDRQGFIPQQPGGTAGADSLSGLGIAGSGLASYGAIAGNQVGTASAAPGMSAPLYSAAWPQQLGQQLLVLSQRGGDQHAELRLNPPDLGPLTVSLKVGEQGTQIQFLAANALVRSAVEQAIPQLREALAEQGITLGETSVGEQRQEAEQGFAGDGTQQQSLASGALQGAGEAELTGPPTRIDTSLDGRVDIYA
ncbi:MAG: flagellar hook-length control protein FliK [Chromatiaceae bacterium]|nr:flagellar hook-length control protein FliK [Chromatiaceae bacterium]MCF8014089.1 flagellar hook-length control protein FliK [Chromatiaceae bacterium]